MEIRLIEGDILLHETDVLILPHYINMEYLHPTVSRVDNILNGAIYEDFVNKGMSSSLGAIKAYKTRDELAAKNIYLFNQEYIQVNKEADEDIIFNNLKEVIPSVLRKIVNDSFLSCTFLMSTLGTLNFHKAPGSYIKGIMKGLRNFKGNHPFHVINQIDFVEQNHARLNTIYESINTILEIPELKNYLCVEKYLEVKSAPVISNRSDLLLRVSWKLNDPLQKQDVGATIQKDNISSIYTDSYDVFISYRRQIDSQTARLIQISLKEHGFKVFLDVDEIGSGHFDERLLNTIKNTENFIIILSLESLDRIHNNDDWLRKEIEQAIITNRNIIPVLMDGFRFPAPKELPEKMVSLPRHNGVEYSHTYFIAMVDQIVKFLR